MAMQRLAWVRAFPRFVALLAAGAIVTCALFAANEEAFVSHRFGYRLSVPRGWHVAVSPSDIPVLFNYDQSKALPQGLIPEGGAEIYLIPYEAVEAVSPAGDLKEWIVANSALWHTNVRSRPVTSWTKDPSYPQQITRVDSDYERAPEDNELQSEVNYYFVLHGRGYRLRLLYAKGALRSSYFNSAGDSVLRSVRAL